MQRNDEHYDCITAALKAARDAFSMLSTDKERWSGIEEILHNLEHTERFDSIWFNEHVTMPAFYSVQEDLERIGKEHPRATVALQAMRILRKLNSPAQLLIQFERELRQWKRVSQRVATGEGRKMLEPRCAHLRERIRQEAEALAATSPRAIGDLFVKKVVDAENDKDEDAVSRLIDTFSDFLPHADDDI
jgi:hypothetical protein